MRITLLIVQAATQVVSAQQNPPPTSPVGEEKQRSASETKKRLEQLACGPSDAHLSHHTVKEPGPLPYPPANRGLIFVIRANDVLVGAALHVKLAVDGKWTGVNRIGNYFYFELDPGPHHFCAEANGRSLLSFVVEEGKTYYLQQKITMGGVDLDLIDEEKGKEFVTKYRRSTSEEKQKK